MSSYLPEDQIHLVEELVCPECRGELKEEIEDGRTTLVCEPCDLAYPFIADDEQMIDAACMGCAFELTAVVEDDIDPVSLLWDRCPDCGDHLVSLI